MADHRHKRETNARRFPRAALVAAPIAVMATLAAVTVGVLASSPQVTPGNQPAAQLTAADLADRADQVSRSSRRASKEADALDQSSLDVIQARLARRAAAAETRRAVLAAKKAKTKLWTTTELNVWTSDAADATVVGELPAGKRILVTGRASRDREEIVYKGDSRWVTAGYLSEKEPVLTGAAAGLSSAPCPDSSVENGLTANAVQVYRSVCHAFPQITSYGGWDSHGEHSSGRALDIMTSDVALGTAIAEYLRAHASELHLYDILWRQRIWTPVRASEGWRTFPSRGSATADHYDHVHVSTY